MRRAYLFLYSNAVGGRSYVKEIIDAMPSVTTWRYDLPNCFYIISENTALELTSDFEEQHGKSGRYLFAELGDTRQGRMPKKTWHLLRHKRHLRDED